MKSKLPLLTLLACLVSFLSHATPPGTAFTYQGRLKEGGTPANGSYVFRFSLDDSNHVPVGSPITPPPLEVSNGLFTVTLDFGGGIFTGASRWLGIEVHTNDNSALFVALTPLQPILPTPYAMYAGGADATGISGIVSNAFSAINATNFSGPLAGDVTGTQGATVVSTVGGQSAATVAGGVSAVSAATDANVAGTLVKRDGNGNLSAGTATLSGALNLPFPAIIYSGTNTLLIAEGSLFYGVNAGNGRTAGAIGNVGLGDHVLSSGTSGPNNTGVGERALEHNSSGSDNTANGYLALGNNTTGSNNTANGAYSLASNADGNHNTANGYWALQFNTTGSANTANGAFALAYSTTGSNNTANGTSALENNVLGSYNTANGVRALAQNTDGFYNTANGYAALAGNAGGNNNTANGYAALSNNGADYNTANGSGALANNLLGYNNTASGYHALRANTTGYYNTANGSSALASNTHGSQNTADGILALASNTDGGGNTASGDSALYANTIGSGNTATGLEALARSVTGWRNIALGARAGFNLTTGDDNIDIGNLGVAAESGAIRIGTQGTHTRTFIAGISEVTVAGGDAVRVTSSGQLGIVTSSARFKRDIRSMADASDVLLSLRPVTFRYKPELDPEAIPQFGLVAEEVAKVDPDLVARDDKNQVYTVRYEAVNAMLLNEFLKQHRKVAEQNVDIQSLKERLEKLEQLMGQLNGGAK